MSFDELRSDISRIGRVEAAMNLPKAPELSQSYAHSVDNLIDGNTRDCGVMTNVKPVETLQMIKYDLMSEFHMIHGKVFLKSKGALKIEQAAMQNRIFTYLEGFQNACTAELDFVRKECARQYNAACNQLEIDQKNAIENEKKKYSEWMKVELAPFVQSLDLAEDELKSKIEELEVATQSSTNVMSKLALEGLLSPAELVEAAKMQAYQQTLIESYKSRVKAVDRSIDEIMIKITESKKRIDEIERLAEIKETSLALVNRLKMDHELKVKAILKENENEIQGILNIRNQKLKVWTNRTQIAEKMQTEKGIAKVLKRQDDILQYAYKLKQKSPKVNVGVTVHTSGKTYADCDTKPRLKSQRSDEFFLSQPRDWNTTILYDELIKTPAESCQPEIRPRMLSAIETRKASTKDLLMRESKKSEVFTKKEKLTILTGRKSFTSSPKSSFRNLPGLKGKIDQISSTFTSSRSSSDDQIRENTPIEAINFAKHEDLMEDEQDCHLNDASDICNDISKAESSDSIA